jgi:hypothetical protein
MNVIVKAKTDFPVFQQAAGQLPLGHDLDDPASIENNTTEQGENDG